MSEADGSATLTMNDGLISIGDYGQGHFNQNGGAITLIHTNGNTGATARYADHMRDIGAVYRGQLRAFYAMEMRWPDSLFWKRRHTEP